MQASIFNFDDVQSFEGALKNFLLIIIINNNHCFKLLFGVLCSMSTAISHKRGKKAVNLGFMLTKDNKVEKYNASMKVWILLLLSVLLVRNLYSLMHQNTSGKKLHVINGQMKLTSNASLRACA